MTKTKQQQRERKAEKRANALRENLRRRKSQPVDKKEIKTDGEAQNNAR